MLPILQIGPLSLQTPGLILLLGLWSGLSLAERYAERFGLNAAQLYNLTFRILIAALVGARFAYVLRFPQVFRSSPLSLFSLNPGLLEPWGAALAALGIGFLYLKRQQIPPLKAFDALTPTLAVLACSLHLANLASGNGYGLPADLPWAIELWGMRRHPVQLYELFAGLGILALLWPARAAAVVSYPASTAGIYFLKFIAWSAAARLFLDFFRGDSQLLPGNFRQAQVIAWLLLAASLWGINRLSQGSQPLHSSADHEVPT